MINPSNYSQGSQKHHTTVTMPFATSWFYQPSHSSTPKALVLEQLAPRAVDHLHCI